MAFRIARATEEFGRRLKPVVAILACLGLGLVIVRPVNADEELPTPTVSSSCDAPAADIATPAPLPNVAADIAARRAIKVLAIGSSSTVGVGASSPGRNYPAQFEAILEKTFKGLDVVIVNRGVSGEVAAATAERMRTLVAIEKPDLVLWQVGTNDALARVPLDDFTATVRDTVRWLKEHEVDTVLVGLQYTLKVSTDEHYKGIRMALREVATSENVLLVRRYEAMEFLEKVKAGHLLSSDDLHMNDLGYRCMAEHIARAVVVSAFLRKGQAVSKAR